MPSISKSKTPPKVPSSAIVEVRADLSTQALDWQSGKEKPQASQAEVNALRQQVFDATAEAYRFNPIGFVEGVLLKRYNAKQAKRRADGETGPQAEDFVLDKWQREVLDAYGRGERRLSIRAGHGVGKSAVCSFMAIHQLVCWYPQKAVVTAPTASQLFDVLYPEIRFWMKWLPENILAHFELFSDHIDLKTDPDGSFLSAKTSSAEKPEAMQGVHSTGRVLLIGDEASGIPEAVFEAAIGSMSGHNCTTALISNPTRNSGQFFKTHHQLKDSWKTWRVSCMDCSRVSADFVKQVADTYGEDSNQFKVRVLGEFPKRDADSLIPADMVDAAMSRDTVMDPYVPLVYGVDIARKGNDRSVICKRRGNVVLEFISWQGNDLMQSTGRIVNEARNDKPASIRIDSIGVGAGVADRLRELAADQASDFYAEVVDVNVSEMVAMNPTCERLRDELWQMVKDWLLLMVGKLPMDPELREELVTPTYDFLSNGKMKVESKSDMKRRGYRSPDKADALCCSFAGDAATIGGRSAPWSKGKALKRNLKGIV